MSDTLNEQEQRDLTALLAFAGREFDRVRTLLVQEEEPGTRQIAEAVDADDASDEKSKGLARKLLSTVGGAAGVAGRLVTGTVHPAHDDWASTPVDDRIDWWVGRFGTAAAALAAIPGLGGKLGKLVGIDDIVGAAAQVLVVNAVARELGIDDVDRRAQAAARIVFGHELDTSAVAAAVDAPEAQPESEAPGDAPEEKNNPLAWAGRTAMLVWRVARRIQSMRSELDNRRKGGLFARALSNLPGVGALGSFVSEKSGISQAADEARTAFSTSA